MAIKIEMLRCFDAVALQGSLQNAAEALGRSPSAVSMMLKQFEDLIGAPLFETARKSRLTPLGEMIHQEARRGLLDFERTVTSIRRLAGAEEGIVRLAATPSAAGAILPGVIRSFVQTHPKVRIDLRDMDSASVRRAMELEQADIGIATLPDVPGLERRHLLSDEFGVVCPADHALTQCHHPLAWADLDGHPFIVNGLCDLIQQPEFGSIIGNSLLSVPNTASLFGLIRAGIGITILPRLVLLPSQTGLAFLPLAECTTRRDLFVIAQPRRLLSPAVRSFLDMLGPELQNN